MFTFSKMPSKIMANTLRNNICLQKFLPVLTSTSVLSNAHIESASPGKSTVWGFPAVTRSHYRNKSCAFLFKKKSDLTPNYCQYSVYSNKHHKRNFLPSLVPWRQKSQCILFRDWKEMCTQAFPTLSRRTNLASGSLAGTGMNVQFFAFFLQSVFLFEFMYDWFHSLGFGLLVSHNSFLEWLGIEINCIWVANGSWLDELDTVWGERKNCAVKMVFKISDYIRPIVCWTYIVFSPTCMREEQCGENTLQFDENLLSLQDNWLDHACLSKPISSAQK